jgi:tRNA nucleotidyltransferase/poly(A) polymerase
MIDEGQFSTEERRLLDVAVQAGRELGVEPWLVGGSVRDLLLGNEVEDIDLVAEGDVEALAGRIGEILGKPVRSFPHFLTYKIEVEGSEPLDIVTARAERYVVPGSLPEVRAATLTDDLRRRDFTVNALAMSLFSRNVADPTGGKEDLQRRELRILHDQSFLDDPTRIFRALRLSTRLEFSIEQQTAERMREAIEASALRTVSRQRVWRELQLAIAESRGGEVLIALADAGALRELLGVGRLTEPERDAMRRVDLVLSWIPPVDRTTVFLATLDPRVLPTGVAAMTSKRAERIRLIGSRRHSVARRLDRYESARLFLLCESELRETLAAAAALSDATASKVQQWVERSRHVSVPRDVVPRNAGRSFPRILRHVRVASLCGTLTPEEAPPFARRKLIKYLRHNSTGPDRA